MLDYCTADMHPQGGKKGFSGLQQGSDQQKIDHYEQHVTNFTCDCIINGFKCMLRNVDFGDLEHLLSSTDDLQELISSYLECYDPYLRRKVAISVSTQTDVRATAPVLQSYLMNRFHMKPTY